MRKKCEAHLFVVRGNLAYLIFACLFAKINGLNYGLIKTVFQKQRNEIYDIEFSS
jgi:hypothetical protein